MCSSTDEAESPSLFLLIDGRGTQALRNGEDAFDATIFLLALNWKVRMIGLTRVRNTLH